MKVFVRNLTYSKRKNKQILNLMIDKISEITSCTLAMVDYTFWEPFLNLRCIIYICKMIKQYDYLFKVVLIGNSSVGKSSLLRRFTDEVFQQTYLATIGVDFRFKTIKVGENVVKFQIWDTAGQQRFRTITGTYYKGAQGIIVVYDITKPQSFEELESYWFKEIDKNAIPKVQLVLLGNKSDLQENRQVKLQTVEEFIKSRGIRHFEVSAKTGDHVTQAFHYLAEQLMKIYPKEEHKNEPMAVVEDIRKKRKQFQLQAGQAEPKKEKKCC